MEIVSENKFSVDIPPERIMNFYLYMTEDPRYKAQVYLGFSPTDTNKACDYLGSYNMPMKCVQIQGTESEVLAYKEKLEDERYRAYNKHQEEQKAEQMRKYGKIIA
jgi:hypothetical protein